MTGSELGSIVVQVLGWSLLHFVWQAALVGVLYALARTALPRGNPRYLAALLALIALAVLPAWTAWHVAQSLAQPADLGDMLVAGSAGATAATATATASPFDWLALLRAALPWLVLAWACGVLFLGVRVARQWFGLRATVSAAEALPVWQERARRLGVRLGLRRAVRVLASVRIATPTLVGWMRPVVVMPLAMLARMPAEQVDLILAHELAHLRRLDHVANLFQVVLETLLFYHPVVHWISRDARNERELCCDRLALRASGGSRRDFVAALAGLEEFRCDHADLALAASGGVLADRAWFIAGMAPQRQRPHHGLTTVLLVLLGVSIALGLVWRQHAARERIDGVLSASAAALRHDLAAVPSLPAPVPGDVGTRRPMLAPVSLVPAREPRPVAVVRPLVAPVASAPTAPSLTVSDIAATPVHVAPLVPHTMVAAAGRAPVAAVPAPQALHSVSPAYPQQALANGLQGRVEIQFTLDAAGVPQDLRVVSSPASGQLDAAALQAMSRWRFAPPAVAGRQYRQFFTFRLYGGAGTADAAAVQDCVPSTGTHICRRPFDNAPGVRVLRPNG